MSRGLPGGEGMAGRSGGPRWFATLASSVERRIDCRCHWLKRRANLNVSPKPRHETMLGMAGKPR